MELKKPEVVVGFLSIIAGLLNLILSFATAEVDTTTVIFFFETIALFETIVSSVISLVMVVGGTWLVWKKW